MYQITEAPFAISQDHAAAPLLLRDKWEAFDKAALQQHFANSCELFMQRIELLQDTPMPLSVDAERELRFMFETLIALKQALVERTED